MKSGSASTYIAGDIAASVPGVPVAEIATLLLALVEELRRCRNVNGVKESVAWVNSISLKDGRRRRVINEIGRKWRGRLEHYDKLEEALLLRCVIVTEAEMAGLFSER